MNKRVENIARRQEENQQAIEQQIEIMGQKGEIIQELVNEIARSYTAAKARRSRGTKVLKQTDTWG